MRAVSAWNAQKAALPGRCFRLESDFWVRRIFRGEDRTARGQPLEAPAVPGHGEIAVLLIQKRMKTLVVGRRDPEDLEQGTIAPHVSVRPRSMSAARSLRVSSRCLNGLCTTVQKSSPFAIRFHTVSTAAVGVS